MSWEHVFADTHFEPSAWTLPIGDVITSNNQINLAPLQFVTDVEPVGYTYHKIVFPDKQQYIVPALVSDDGIDLEELLDCVREAELDDYYALLGLEEKGLASTDADFKKTWKHINLHCHPDKAEPSRKADAERRFKACTKAFETLTTPNLRVDYDSHYKFDDAIPAANAGSSSIEAFLRLYTPIFEANARFSKIKPVPSLGDANISEKALLAFYNFWGGFSSWREFNAGDEKVGDGASRYERREAEQKSKKAREVAKIAENKRIRTMVERAQAADPRLKAFKEKKPSTKTPNQPKLAAKQAVIMGKGAAPNTSPTAKLSSQQLAANVAAQKAKETEEAEKKAINKLITESKSRLKGSLLNELSMVGKKEQIELVLTRLTSTYEDCVKINDILLQRGYNDILGKNGHGILEVPQVINIINEYEGKPPVVVPDAVESTVKEWSQQELQLLYKGCDKIVIGTANRWQKVADFVNQANAGATAVKRTEKDIIRKLKEQELVRQFGGKDKLNAAKAAMTGTTPTPVPNPASTSETTNFAPDVLTWTPEEQKLLEAGLTTVSKDASDRWDQIASVVGTRSRSECAERFRYLREQIQKKKEAAAAAKK